MDKIVIISKQCFDMLRRLINCRIIIIIIIIIINVFSAEKNLIISC